MQSILPYAALAIAAVPTAASAETPIIADATLLDVTAIGRVTRTPDLATIRAGVVTQASIAAAAVSENAARMARVVAALKAAGIADRDLSTSNLSLSPQYRYVDNRPPVVTGYQASNTVSVRFRDIARSGRVLDTLVAQGANQIDGPALSLDKPEEALDEARAQAVATAQARAGLYAKAAGLRVERILSIDENGEDAGGPQPPMPYRVRTMAAEAAPTQVLPGETDVTVTLAVRFLLK